MCFGAKVAGRGTRPAQLRGTRAAEFREGFQKGRRHDWMRLRCQRSSRMCFGAKLAGRGTRPAQLRGTRAA